MRLAVILLVVIASTASAQQIVVDGWYAPTQCGDCQGGRCYPPANQYYYAPPQRPQQQQLPQVGSPGTPTFKPNPPLGTPPSVANPPLTNPPVVSQPPAPGPAATARVSGRRLRSGK